MMLAPTVHGGADLLSETGRSEIRYLGRNQPPAEPGRAVLGRDDEAELMPILLAAINEGIAIGAVFRPQVNR